MVNLSYDVPIRFAGIIDKVTIEGVSMMYSFDDAEAKSPRTTQYFEMVGNRAIYNDGWIATARHGRLPWEHGASEKGSGTDSTQRFLTAFP